MLLAFLTPLLARLPDGDGTKAAWVMAIPVAANLGGLGTPIGTPPNAIAIGQLAQSGIEVGFGSWMLHMVPYVIVMLVISWGILIWLYPMSDERVSLDIEVPTEFGRDFWIVAVVFPLTIGLWITSEWTHIDSNVVAMIPFAVFAVLGIFKSEDFSRIEWHVLWMVAGGFALGHCLNDTGLANVLVKAIPFAEWSTLILMLGAGLIIYMLSTFISNSSAANLLMPMLAVVATSMNEQMAAVGGTANMLVFVALSCSLAMTLPISTPPNALACSSGLVQTRDMVKVGLIIGVVGAVLGFFWLKVFPF
jgi:sodium-dependent dicarboxylate transporter 2/3/5